ncbi:hypothetical protein DYBT9623_05453 [Dyadobacter sp. CECT 9623]|uniref:Uncharacterized protein n=1 Tax=Dyadobacter linearis TaxID=2823330 RepID=A0ABN7RIU5_9BACT|nr:hypothetical protein DYBT9623_05453 [Dyadobacter sp. CECT 9623]
MYVSPDDCVRPMFMNNRYTIYVNQVYLYLSYYIKRLEAIIWKVITLFMLMTNIE